MVRTIAIKQCKVCACGTPYEGQVFWRDAVIQHFFFHWPTFGIMYFVPMAPLAWLSALTVYTVVTT